MQNVIVPVVSAQPIQDDRAPWVAPTMDMFSAADAETGSNVGTDLTGLS
jgi:hypothetical protein